MSSFHNTKETENPTVSKVMALGSVLTSFSQFSRYPNHFNSNFDPRIDFGKGNLIIFAMALVPTCFDSRIKIRVSGALGS